MLLLRRLSIMVATLLMLGASAGAWAQRGPARDRGPIDMGPPLQAQPRAPKDSLSDSVRRVERDTRGQVLSAERVPYDGREVHRVKVLDDRGRVRVYMDDPQTRRRDDLRQQRPPTRDDDD